MAYLYMNQEGRYLKGVPTLTTMHVRTAYRPRYRCSAVSKFAFTQVVPSISIECAYRIRQTWCSVKE